MKLSSISITLCATLVLMAGEAVAVTLRYEAVVPEGAPQRNDFSMTINQQGVAIVPEDRRQSSVVYLADSAEVRFIDHSHREYTVMTEAWLAEAREKADAAMEQTRERLESRKDSMSPQMRAQVEQGDMMMRMMPLFGGLLGGSSQVTYSRNSRSSEFNGVSCEQFDELVDGTKTRILCMGRAADAGLADDASAMLSRFQALLTKLGSMGLFDFGFSRPEVMVSDTLPGIVVAVSYPDGGGYLVSGQGSDGDDAGFDIPESYLRA